jgi:hypothetical protein
MSEAEQDEALDNWAMARLEALSVFENAMVEAAKEYAKADTPSELRGAAAAALGAAHRLMVATGMHANVGPVVASAFALGALDEGVTMPLARVSPRKAKRPDVPNVVWVQRAVIAAALEQRFRKVGNLPHAAAEVALWLADFGIAKSTIISWRHEVSGGAGRSASEDVFTGYVQHEAGEYVTPLGSKSALLREMKIWGWRGIRLTPDLKESEVG